jgi:hypothetical protein
VETAFDTIGIDITNQKTFDNLAEEVEKRGEASHLLRKSGVLYGRCFKPWRDIMDSLDSLDSEKCVVT